MLIKQSDYLKQGKLEPTERKDRLVAVLDERIFRLNGISLIRLPLNQAEEIEDTVSSVQQQFIQDRLTWPQPWLAPLKRTEGV